MQVPRSWFQGLTQLGVPSVTKAANRHLESSLTEDDLLALAPAATQRMCMNPVFKRLCKSDFWLKKALLLGHAVELPFTFDDYGVLAMKRGIPAYAALTIHTKAWFLDALDKQDLDRFRYYVLHSKITPESSYTKTIEWFAYFAGKEFYNVWVREVRFGTPDSVVRAMIYAFTGDTDRFFCLSKTHPSILSHVHIYMNLAASGGSLPILGGLLTYCKRYGYAVDAGQLVSQAKHYSQPEILMCFGEPKGKIPPPKIYRTRPFMRYGRYVWTAGIAW